MMTHNELLLDCGVIDSNEFEFRERVAHFEFLLCRHYLTFRWQSDAVLGKANLSRTGSGANSSEPGNLSPIPQGNDGRESERPVAVDRELMRQQSSHGHRQFAQPHRNAHSCEIAGKGTTAKHYGLVSELQLRPAIDVLMEQPPKG